jgi:hypothetical protein
MQEATMDGIPNIPPQYSGIGRDVAVAFRCQEARRMMRCDSVLSFRVSVSEDYRMRNMTVVLGPCVWGSPKALTLLGRTGLRAAMFGCAGRRRN